MLQGHCNGEAWRWGSFSRNRISWCVTSSHYSAVTAELTLTRAGIAQRAWILDICLDLSSGLIKHTIPDIRASDGNRTRTTCLGSRSSAIELRSRGRLGGTR
jgi:hypothetical protein